MYCMHMCMYVCMHTYWIVGAHTYIHMHACIHTYTYVHTYIRIYVHTYIHRYTHTYIQYIHTYICTHTHIDTYIHMYIRTHACIQTYIYIYTYHTIPVEDLLATVALLSSAFTGEVTRAVSLGEAELSFIPASCLCSTAAVSFSAATSVFTFFCYNTWTAYVHIALYVYIIEVNMPIQVTKQSLHWLLIHEGHISFQYVSLLHKMTKAH